LSFPSPLATLLVSTLDTYLAADAAAIHRCFRKGHLQPEIIQDRHLALRLQRSVNHNMARTSAVRNDYRCSIERNQSGKYCVRVQVHYPRHAWTLSVFFLAGSFDRSMKKLEEALDFLQRQEEKLWFWGVDRAEDMGFSAEFLKDAGLKLDRRNEFPRKATNVSLAPERQVPAFVLGPMRRGLAESVEVARSVVAGD
jgi:hypothetical protein